MERSIVYLRGNIFFSPADVIVNPVNIFGVMGKGLAAQFKKKYPRMFESYKKKCDEKILQVGRIMLVSEVDHRIMLFPTKKHWKYPSKLEYVEAGLRRFVAAYEKYDIKSIAFPPLGCGYGGLSWEEQVQPLMEKYLGDLPIKIYVYLHFEQDEKKFPIVPKDGVDFSVDGLFNAVNDLSKNFSIAVKDTSYKVEIDGRAINFSSAEKKFSVDEKFLQSTLAEIDEQNILKAGKLSKKFLLYVLMRELGYLADVEIFDDEKNKFIAGFQLNRGAMKIFEHAQKNSSGEQTLLFAN